MPVRSSGMVSEGCGDVGGLGQAQDGDREVAQAGHDAGGCRCGPGTGPRRTSRRGPNGVGPRWTSDRAARRRARPDWSGSVSYTHLRAHETVLDLVCRLLLEKKKKNKK